MSARPLAVVVRAYYARTSGRRQRCSKNNRVGHNNRNRIVNNPDYSISIILKVLLLYDYFITIILKVL